MTPVFTAAGCDRGWTLSGGQSVAAWLARRPWTAEGGVQSASIPTRGEGPVASWLEQAFQAATRGCGRWHWLPLPNDSRPVTTVLRSWLGGSDSERSLVRQLVELAQTAQRVFVLVADIGVRLAPLEQEAASLVEMARKLDDSPGLAVLVLGREPGPRPRLDVGWPLDDAGDGDAPAVWGTYLHQRLAWHAGGRVDIALEVGDGAESLPTGSDAALEDRLGRDSGARLDTLPTALARSLSTSLAPIGEHPELMLQVGTNGRSHRIPVPWLARGLLVRHPQHPCANELRITIGCRPIAGRLLMRCMLLEAQMRDSLLLSPLSEPAPDEAVGQLSRLRSPAQLEAKLWLRGVPLPTNAWDLASFGRLVQICRERSDLPPVLDELRRVRNALAHGGGAGWEAIAAVGRLEERWGRVDRGSLASRA